MEIGESVNPVFSRTIDSDTKTWIRFRFLRKPRSKRHNWWPVNVHLPYGGEKYGCTLTNGSVSDRLSGNGTCVHSFIPEGSCEIKFDSFYEEVKNYIEENLK